MTNGKSKSAEIRARLGHPVIDADGHWVEYGPALNEYVAAELGRDAIKRFWGGFSNPAANFEDPNSQAPSMVWWHLPTKSVTDRATAMLPKLMHERLGEMGMDFSVLFPTIPGLLVNHALHDPELRQAGCRAYNKYTADMFRDYTDRLCPVASIPMHTPEEAVAELEHVKQLGFKVVALAGLFLRPRRAGGPAAGAPWHELIGLDTECDYDPVWAKLLELKLAPTFHSIGLGVGFRLSQNFVNNHIGHFASAGAALCKALFLGGITRRFPDLKFMFLEGGVTWGCSVYNDLVGHWKARNPRALERVNPANLDRARLAELIQRLGHPVMREVTRGKELELNDVVPAPADLDDYRKCGIETAEEIRELFVPHFYFGCEAEDPMIHTAFNTRANAYGARLNAVLGSDIGHWDVAEMAAVLEESYELVEHGIISEDNLRDFTFTNPVGFLAGMNPDFFKGTAVEKEVASLMVGN
jgi:Amidohydrolase